MLLAISTPTSLDPSSFPKRTFENPPADIKTIRIVIKIIRIKLSFQVGKAGLSLEPQL